MKNILCKLGFHKPKVYHYTIKHKYRTTNKGRSKKEYTCIKEVHTVTYCERCNKILSNKRKLKY